MSRSKLFNMIKSRGENQLGKNVFDLSNRHVYTSKAAKITPVKALHTYPDDYFEVELSEFSQNNVPMNTAAFLSGKKELLAYFVPYNTIWHNFNQYQSTREDPDSTLLHDKGISYEPRIGLFDLYMAALYFYLGKFVFADAIIFAAMDIATRHAARQENGFYLWDVDGAYSVSTFNEAVTHFENITPNGSSLNCWQIAMNEAVSAFSNYEFSHFNTNYGVDYQNFAFGVPFTCYEYEVLQNTDLTYFDTISDLHGNFIWCDFVQKLDMLGYGNVYPILHELDVAFNERIERYRSEWHIGETGDRMSPSSLSWYLYDPRPAYSETNRYSITDGDFDPYNSPQMAPFADVLTPIALKITNMGYYYDSEGEPQKEYVNVYSIYAYNRCFYDYMRNVYFDTDYYVYNYNCDFLDCKTLNGSILTLPYIPLRWYHLETHQWKKDMFTGVLPDNQLGQVSEVILDTSATSNVSENIWFNTTHIQGSPAAGVDSDVVATIGSDSQKAVLSANQTDASFALSHGHTATTNVEASLNVLALKRAEAIQQYRQDLMRAGNRTKDIFNQIYGSTPKSELDECPYFIEVASNDIDVNPIIATAETGQNKNGSLGDIAARSTISGDSLKFKFSTQDFGVVLFLSYIVPDSFYNSYRLDPFVTHLDQEAHGLPYFQNLGLQPVIGAFLSNINGATARAAVRGFAPPYIERKTDIDLVHGNLVDCFLPKQNSQDADVEYQGSLSHWVVARTDMQQGLVQSLKDFYINPRILDNVFTMNAGDDYESDHYLTYCSIHVKAIRAFSEIGLPRF